MKVVPVPYKYPNPLVNNYLNNFSEVAHLFEHNPYGAGSFADRYTEVIGDYRMDRHKLVQILRTYNEKLQCGEKTRANIEKLQEPGTVAVVTGQQAGVFTGPLYTVYKAITAIQLSEHISDQIGQDVIPVFWVAAEDHDFAEIDHVDLVNREHEIIRLKLDYTPSGKYSIGQMPVTSAVTGLIEQLEAKTNASEWKPDIVEKLRRLAGEADNLADWFALTMAWLFDDFGLVMVNPMNPELRQLWGDTFADFLNKSELVTEKLGEGIKRVRNLGVEPQVEKEEHNVNLFLYVDGERLPLFKSGSVFTVRGRSETWTLPELTQIARETPELLSPNVVLRPVAQDVLLPIMAYVAGPGEISYYALYREIYPIFNQRMPIIYPRVNITLIERGTAKHMEIYRTNFADGPSGINSKLEEWLKEQDQIDIESLFSSYTSDLQTSFQELIKKTAEISPELTIHGSESLNKILHQISHFEQKALQYHRKSCDIGVKRFRQLENQLFPKGNLQERVFNIFPYLFKYGLGFMDNLIQLPLMEGHNHNLVYLGE